MPESPFRCYKVDRDEQGKISAGISQCRCEWLPPGEVLIRVSYSSLNYKDAMAATGHPAIAKSLPHVPGIDAAGIVEESSDPRYRPGDAVIATGHEFGVERWGGWSEYMRAPADWLVPLPSGLTLEEAMIIGTAGFTAAQCVRALQRNGVSPERGEIVVTGGTGGVGSIAIMLLSRLGYKILAVSGKPAEYDWLKSIGAAEVAGREMMTENSSRPLLSARFAGGIDTVGGRTLSTMCKMIDHRGCIACCGVAGGAELDLTVYPFILRGLTLCGIDSAWCPEQERAEIWWHLSDGWKPLDLRSAKRLVGLRDLPEYVDKILHGENVGRVVVDLSRG